MPRPHKKQIPLLAASPSMAAAMIGVTYRDVLRAIDEGKLSVCTIGKRRRVIIADAVEWLRTSPPSFRSPRKPNGVSDVRNENHAS